MLQALGLPASSSYQFKGWAGCAAAPFSRGLNGLHQGGPHANRLAGASTELVGGAPMGGRALHCDHAHTDDAVGTARATRHSRAAWRCCQLAALKPQGCSAHAHIPTRTRTHASKTRAHTHPTHTHTHGWVHIYTH